MKKVALGNKFTKYYLKTGLIFFTVTSILLFNYKSYSQESDYKTSVVKAGLGIAHQIFTYEESRIILTPYIGWEKSLGKTNNISINPNLIWKVNNILFDQQRNIYDQYTLAGLELNGNYTYPLYKTISLVGTVGALLYYQKWKEKYPPHTQIRRDPITFVAIKVAIGIRIDPVNRPFAFEIKPLCYYTAGKKLNIQTFQMGIIIKKPKQSNHNLKNNNFENHIQNNILHIDNNCEFN